MLVSKLNKTKRTIPRPRCEYRNAKVRKSIECTNKTLPVELPSQRNKKPLHHVRKQQKRITPGLPKLLATQKKQTANGPHAGSRGKYCRITS